MGWDLIPAHNTLAAATTRSGTRVSTDPPKRTDAPEQRVNWQYMIVFTVAQLPTQCIPFRVPSGSRVKIRAYNGATTGNSAAVYVGRSATDVSGGNAIALAPLDYVEFPVENTARVWARGAAGDAVIVSVASSA